MKIINIIKSIALVPFLWLCMVKPLSATTVLEVEVDDLLESASLIAEAEVLASEARWNADHTYITTHVTFRLKEALKGKAPAPTITIEYSGGTVGDTRLRVESMVYPAEGDNGIYFFERPGQRQVHPLVGWSQGHIRIVQDAAGSERVLTEGGAPILGLQAPAGDAGEPPGFAPFSHGVARGLAIGRRGDPPAAAMEKEQFKEALKKRLKALRAGAADGRP